jgi:hypothetical protein
VIDHHFQQMEGVVRTSDRREILNAMTLRGTELTFTLNITLVASVSPAMSSAAIRSSAREGHSDDAAECNLFVAGTKG